MAHCINISNPEFISLQEETKYSTTVLKAKVATGLAGLNQNNKE